MWSIGKFDDANTHHPMDIRYMKLLRSLLNLICSWPHKVLGEQVRPLPLRDIRFLFSEAIFVSVGGMIYVRNNYKEVTFLEMGQTYLTIFLGVVAAQRVSISWFQSYHDTMREFVQEVHLFHHRQKSEYCEQIHQKIHRTCDIFTTVIVAELFLGIFLFNTTPMYNNYKKGMFNVELNEGKRFEHSIHFALPYINQRDSVIVYIPILLINVLFSCDCCVCFSSFDITLSIIVFHIWGHLKILDHMLKSIPLPAAMREQPGWSGDDGMHYSIEENKQVAAMLKDIVDHHRMIMRFLDKTSKAFGPMLCLYYLFYQVSGCILLLECSEMDPRSLTRYGPLSASLFQLFIQISVIVELLGSQSETLKDAVYGAPWECMDAGNRRLLLFLLCHVQEPIRLKPLGMVSVGVQTMFTILKTTFSYFMLLRTFE